MDLPSLGIGFDKAAVKIRGLLRRTRPAFKAVFGNSIFTRLFAASLVVVLVVLPASGYALLRFYQTAVTGLFDDTLQKDLNELLASEDLRRQLASLVKPKKGKMKSVYVAPDRLHFGGGDRFNLLSKQFHWQVSKLSGPHPFNLVSASLEGRALQLPSASHPGSAPDQDSLYRGYANSPVADDDDMRPRLRLLETQVLLGTDDKGVLYAFAVAKDVSEIEANVARFRNILLTSFAALGLALLAAFLAVLRFGLAPLGAMRKAIAGIRAGRAKMLVGSYPDEIAPLQDELNTLLRSKESVVERARTHVGNLAHALKTPLSVIVNEARSADGDVSARIAEQAEVMERQITHHLDRARMAAMSDVIGEVTEVCPVLEKLVRTLQTIHAGKELQIKLTCAPGTAFRGERQDLEEMAGNLLDNACKWAERRITVSAARARGGDHVEVGAREIVIEIEDDGPGLDDAAKREVVERGKRLDTQVPGTGLGLSIVDDLARMYEGRLELSDAAPRGVGGLRATLRLPAAR